MTERFEAAKAAADPTEQSGGVSLKLLNDSMGKIDPQLNICLQQARKQYDKTTTEAEAPCYQTAMKSWDDMLNTSYHYLMKELSSWPSPEAKNKIIEAERQWIKSRDEQFKAIEDWTIASEITTGSIPEDRSIEGLDKKVDVVRKQAESVFGLRADLSNPYDWDKPL